MIKKSDWKKSVVYQIYPRSFNDSNSDGVGDIKGIIEKVPYLKDLGVNVIWLSPVYASPNDDNGYDISDYYSINPDFGTMKDMEKLISIAKKDGIRILMDLVVNHTSDEHEWFKKAKSDKNSKYHDYYIWSEGTKKPNNWRSFFQGSVWEWNENTNENYLHLFTKKQPDLNWENMELRSEIYKMMRWWLDKGIGGFRMDVCNLYKKPDLYQNSTEKTDIDGLAFDPVLYANNPGIHEILQEMNQEVFSKYDCLTVGENVEVRPEDGILYTKSDRNELNMVFHFEHVSLEEKTTKNLRNVLKKWIPIVTSGGWTSNYLSNHDQPRSVSVFGDDVNYREESATLLATLNFTLPGTPYIYQGEELAMTNMKFTDFSQFDDVETFNGIHIMKKEGKTDEFILDHFRKKSRDNARTPIQWDETTNAGFSDVKPWIVVNPNYKNINAKSQIFESNSVFSYYKTLIGLRNKFEVLIHGDCEFILEDDDSTSNDIIAYTREYNSQKMVTILNRSSNKHIIPLEETIIEILSIDHFILDNLTFLNGNPLDCTLEIIENSSFVLKPWQSLIIIGK